MRTAEFRAALLAVVLLSAAVLAGCGHMPWGRRSATPPRPVDVLVETGDAGAATPAYPQYWKRNTLVIDLQSVAGSGSVTVAPPPGARWPVRIALRVRPGSIGLLEVQADQRLLMPVTREGTAAVDLELVPGVYTARTRQLTIKWEPAKAPAS
jgi:hypothetical protein